MLENFLIFKQCVIQLHNFRKKVIKILCHRHWERMGVDPKALPFLCIECNGKSVKFDTIAKIKVTSVLEIFVSLRYVMYIHMICEKKNKNRDSPFI